MHALPTWAWLWIITTAIVLAFKLITFWPMRRRGAPARRMAYLLGWYGMDARAFLGTAAAAKPARREWIAAAMKLIIGCALVWLVVPMLPREPVMWRGWVGMIGVALILHFGLFHLLALLWQWRGVRAEPVMRQPARSRSLAEFWGGRWNTAYRALSQEWIIRPIVRRRGGIVLATAAAFLFSGLLHDAVISSTARAGYGLPTLYFFIQLIGVLLERRFNWPADWRGRAIAFAFIVLPLPLLFHPPFMRNVMAPFIDAIT